ncbi:MAG: peroxide stress protein YaaA [Pseudohongiellaceae bacterium]|nr:peroxide stress protein YaaA [Pseudohongiellaceae bacterium]
MLVVISPAKTLDFETPVKTRSFTQADFLDDSQALIETLRQKSPEDISKLMSISPALGELNYERFMNWHRPFDAENARQAVFAFKGDVYVGLDAYSLSSQDLKFAQNHLRILSGLYGILRPLDLIQAYRLEMGTKLSVAKSKSLYEFWGDKLTDALNSEFKSDRSAILVNLASNEYFKAVNKKRLSADIISPVFKDYKNGQYKIISFYAKKARGLMSAYIIKNRIKKLEDLYGFDLEGYQYSPRESSDNAPVFLRKVSD